MIVVERGQEIGGGGSRGTLKGRSGILEQGGGYFVEGRTDNSVEPGGPGVELLRQPGLKEDGGLSAQGRHFAEEYEERGEGEKRGLETMRTELTLIHVGFYLGRPKGFPQSWIIHPPFVLSSHPIIDPKR